MMVELSWLIDFEEGSVSVSNFLEEKFVEEFEFVEEMLVVEEKVLEFEVE